MINLIFTFFSINWFLIFTPFFNFTSFNWFLIWSLILTLFLILNNPFICAWPTISASNALTSIFHLTTSAELTLLILTFLLIIFIYSIFNSSVKNYKELPLLLLITYFGFTTLIISNDLIILYLSIELFSLTFYLITTIHQNYFTTEAGIKYFIYNFIAGGFYLLGSVIIYFNFGTICFTDLAGFFIGPHTISGTWGFIFILISFLFKFSIAPFHFWTPDIYVGVLYPITGYFTIIPKFVIGSFLLNMYVFVFTIPYINNLLLFLSLLSIFIGTMGALNQYNIKRLLAYSTIANGGFLVLLIYFGTPFSSQIFYIYLLSYLIANIGLFGSLINLNISNMLGLKNIVTSNPIYAIFFSIPIFSLAGLPPFIGFIGKFLSFFLLISKKWLIIAGIIITLSILSLFYYLRLVHYIFFYDKVPQMQMPLPRPSLYQSYIIIFSSFTLLLLTINPSFVFLLSSLLCVTT